MMKSVSGEALGGGWVKLTEFSTCQQEMKKHWLEQNTEFEIDCVKAQRERTVHGLSLVPLSPYVTYFHSILQIVCP